MLSSDLKGNAISRSEPGQSKKKQDTGNNAIQDTGNNAILYSLFFQFIGFVEVHTRRSPRS